MARPQRAIGTTTMVRLPYVDRFRDRLGKVRFYFRRPGGKRTPLPGVPGSEEFLDAYRLAAAGVPPKAGARRRTIPSTFDALAVTYYGSPNYLRLKPSTRGEYRRAIDALMREIGPRSVAGMKREHVQRMVAARAATPGTAHNALKVLRVLIRFALDAKMRGDDPTVRVRA